MSRIESRPSKREMGEYLFFVDLMLPPSGADALTLALDQLRPLCEHLTLFGTYPLDTVQSEADEGS
jgi:prephenate dehydratase